MIPLSAAGAATTTPRRVEASPDTPPIVILPGFGNASRDYLAPFGDEDASLVAALARRGFSSRVLQVRRKDWLRVGRMALSRNFWNRRCTTEEGYGWYLERVQLAVNAARDATGHSQVILLGHSAGGWLGRAFIGQQRWKDDPVASGDDVPHEAVAALVTLGTPHSPPRPGSKAKDMTGGALTWVDSTWPGAFFAPAGVSYVTVASRAVRGDVRAPQRSLERYAAGSYEQVAGEGHGVEGDAVVPLDSALLDGAHHVVLDDVLHSMSRLGTFEEPSEQQWYGSDPVLDTWLAPLVAGVHAR